MEDKTRDLIKRLPDVIEVDKEQIQYWIDTKVIPQKRKEYRNSLIRC